MRRTALAFVLLAAAALGAADSPFTFPEVVAPPAPAPKPDPAAVPKLGAGQYYVVASKVEASVRGYPAGIVTVTAEKGPLTVRAVFVGGSGKVETKKFTDPFVYLVEASGTGRCDLVVTPLGLKADSEIVVKQLDVDNGTAPQPPPGPNPPAPPNPAPKGFRVIFVYETSAALTPAMQQVMFGAKVRDYLDAKTVAGAGGKGWRRWDKDVDAKNEKDADLKALWNAARSQVTTIPCVIVAVDGRAEIVPFPSGEDDALATFKKYGGN